MKFGGTIHCGSNVNLGEAHSREDLLRQRMAVLEERFEDIRRIECELLLFTEEVWSRAIRRKLRRVAKAYNESEVAATAKSTAAKQEASEDIASFETADMHRRHLEMSLYIARQGAEIAQALLTAEQTLCRTWQVQRETEATTPEFWGSV